MVAPSGARLVLVGRLATPAAEAISPTLEGKAMDFFREVCRVLPWAVKNYKMEELTTLGQLRSNVKQLFKQNDHIQDPKVVDLLIYKGREELEMVVLQHKQRHHLVSEYVIKPTLAREAKAAAQQYSPFLKDFYGSSQKLAV